MGRKKKVPIPPKKEDPNIVLSHPTLCIHCHLTVEMFHEKGADPVKGAWLCPRCSHKYPFTHWQIKRKDEPKVRGSNPDEHPGGDGFTNFH